jgi:hypothetical protein
VTGSRPDRAALGAAAADAALRRQVPTHLDVEDRPFAGLTVRQVLCLAVGGAWGYAAWCGWPWLPAPLRLAAALACVALTFALVAVRPGGRGLAGWAAVALRHALAPRVAVWRPDPLEPEAAPVGPARPADAGQRCSDRRPARPAAPAAPEGRRETDAWEAWSPVAAWTRSAAGRPGPSPAGAARHGGAVAR